jgi:hypothetical protein
MGAAPSACQSHGLLGSQSVTDASLVRLKGEAQGEASLVRLPGCWKAKDAHQAEVGDSASGLHYIDGAAFQRGQRMINHQLIVASHQGDVPGIMRALNCGAEIESQRSFVVRLSASHGASDYLSSSMEVVETPRLGLTALMRAATEGHPLAVSVLLAHGASVNACDEDLMTPLHFAAEAGCMDSCWLLLAAGACSFALDDFGRTARKAVPEKFTKTREEQRAWDELLQPGPLMARLVVEQYIKQTMQLVAED